MKQKMTPRELAEWTERMRRLFRGLTPMDEELLRLALPRIACLEPSVAHEALEQYALKWAGENGRFIASSFLETAQQVGGSQSSRPAMVDPQPKREVEKLHRKAEMERLREEIRLAPAGEIASALALLARAGWPKPPADVAAWGNCIVVATYDLLRGRLCPVLQPDGTWRETMPASEFYTRVAAWPRGIE